MIEETILIIILLIFTIVTLLALYKSGSILNKLKSSNIDYNDYPIVETVEYNPKKDILCISVGTEDEIPPPQVFEKIKDALDELPKCKMVIFPGIFRIVVMRKNG